jgi:hypothetical protein
VSQITTGASSRSLLKLAALVGYVTLMMVSLIGLPSLRAQSTAMQTPVVSNLTVKPANLNYGFQIVLPPDGVPSSPRNVTMSVAKNQPQPVTIESLAVSDPTQYFIQSNTCTVIAPGTSCSVPIVFQPTGLKRRSAVLMITSNAANDGGVQSVALVGFGRQGTLSISPGSLSFPSAMVGGSPTRSQSITLSNRNAVQLSIGGISSSNPGVFQLTNACPAALQPSAQCTLSVSFAANKNGLNQGRIDIVDNAAGPNRVGLSGNGHGGRTVTPTATPTRTATPSPTKVPGPFPMRAFPAMH